MTTDRARRTSLLVLAVVLAATVPASHAVPAGPLCRPASRTATAVDDRTVVALDITAVENCDGRLRIAGRSTSPVATVIWFAAEPDPARTTGRIFPVQPVVVDEHGAFDQEIDVAAVAAPQHVLRLWLARTTPAGDILLRGLRTKKEPLTSGDLAVLAPSTVALVTSTDVCTP